MPAKEEKALIYTQKLNVYIIYIACKLDIDYSYINYIRSTHVHTYAYYAYTLMYAHIILYVSY